MMKSFPGYFITLEGGEGSGKSSLLTSLAKHLIEKKYQVVTTREPGGTGLGEQLREMVLSQTEPPITCALTELLLFLAARAEHLHQVIIPALQQGAIVLCDRFSDSTIAYQCARGLKQKEVKWLCQMVCGQVLPQLTLLLDIDPVMGLSRTLTLNKQHALAGQLDRIESETVDFHRRVRALFLKLAKKEPLRIYSIDASSSKEQVFKEALRAVEEMVLLPREKN